jgi:hypothetical protein
MKMLNSVIIEGVMTAGFTTDGRFTVENIRLEGGETKKTILLCKLSDEIIASTQESVHSGLLLRLVGYLGKLDSGDNCLFVENIEKIGARMNGYVFTNN